METRDLRGWIAEADRIGELKRINGADWKAVKKLLSDGASAEPLQRWTGDMAEFGARRTVRRSTMQNLRGCDDGGRLRQTPD